jgi:hypothetical protein
MLQLLQLKAQNADTRYWEQKVELAQENNSGKTEKANDKSSSSSSNNNNNASSSNNNSNNNSSKKNDKKSGKGQKQQNSGKQQQASRSTPKNDLSSKLDSSGKLTQQDCQCQMNNNLCLFCGKGSHKVSKCRLKDNSSKVHAVTTTSADSESKEKKPAESKKE